MAMRKVLVANRGEIACRVIAESKVLGLSTVAVCSEADVAALHVALADESHTIGPAAAKQSYLVADAVLAAALASGADAIHPGYGFLAENAGFAQRVLDAGLCWIGPTPDSIACMGDKERARGIAKAAGVPVLPGSARFQPGRLDGLEEAAEVIGYPLLVKASAGGGGIGMKRVDAAEALRGVVEATQSMAGKAFGDGTIYLEKLVDRPRHVEVQVFGFGPDHHVHMFERDCSVQRRFQKVIEESPSPSISAATRAAMSEAAVALARQQNYRGAGTVEFIVAPDDGFYFLEMNTRIQVEHPVTEMVTGLNLVGLQLRQAGDEDLGALQQDAITAQGHAIQCRIYAENPDMNFMPSPGPLTRFRLPTASEGVRFDCGFREGDQITFHYDPMIAKAICHAETRDAAIDRMIAALGGIEIEGLKTNIPFLRRTLDHPAFRAGTTHTGFIDEHRSALIGA